MPASVRDPVPVPDGLYAVADPDDPGRLTYWSVAGGAVRDYPPGTRWRPMPPPHPVGLPRDQQAAVRQRWYAGPYRRWRDAVDAAIVADPAGAAARFQARYPEATLPEPPQRRRSPARIRRRAARRQSPAQHRRRVEMLTAAALAETGMSVRAIADVLGLSRTTAWRRITAGSGPYTTSVPSSPSWPPLPGPASDDLSDAPGGDRQ